MFGLKRLGVLKIRRGVLKICRSLSRILAFSALSCQIINFRSGRDMVAGETGR